MSDTLASINVDQLSSAVNAVVQPADSSTQQEPAGATGSRNVQNAIKNQVSIIHYHKPCYKALFILHY